MTDTRVGIAPENLTRIFNHGFTTRKDGHGFGLHSGALAAKEMGGSLYAHSDGVGRGATFTLELPRESPSLPVPSHSCVLERMRFEIHEHLSATPAVRSGSSAYTSLSTERAGRFTGTPVGQEDPNYV